MNELLAVTPRQPGQLSEQAELLRNDTDLHVSDIIRSCFSSAAPNKIKNIYFMDFKGSIENKIDSWDLSKSFSATLNN